MSGELRSVLIYRLLYIFVSLPSFLYGIQYVRSVPFLKFHYLASKCWPNNMFKGLKLLLFELKSQEIQSSGCSENLNSVLLHIDLIINYLVTWSSNIGWLNITTCKILQVWIKCEDTELGQTMRDAEKCIVCYELMLNSYY